MPKHIIFVIDISSSMEGRKLEQTKDAMTTMLGKMSESSLDNFNIILFDDEPRSLWRPQIIDGFPMKSISFWGSKGLQCQSRPFQLT